VVFRLNKVKLVDVAVEHLGKYPTPININYFWGFGSLAGLCLVIQIVTGICLAMHYTPDVALAFESVEHIMRDVNFGWLIRYVHSNGASMFFIVVYIHMARGLFYQSFRNPRERLWGSGVVIFILMMATAFMGYVLPWGQMSFWGATVITNLFSAIPFIGEHIAYWLWGGFSVDNPTLKRFFSLHYLLPFLIVAVVLVHLIFLHQHGSSNPVNGLKISDKVTFYPYFVIKDMFGLFVFFLFFSFFVFFFPNSLAHPDNYIRANAMVTPPHIVPEWYFLPFYAMLRSIPDKLGGVICMGLSLVVLFVLPFLVLHAITSPKFDTLYSRACTFFILDVIFLGWLGAQPVEDICILAGQIATLYYFGFLLILIPLLGNLNLFLQMVNLEKKSEKLTLSDALDYLINGEFRGVNSK
jgi:ubiquinol-cytochrome c reductase cytochrome b/c1 subunit